MTSNMPEIGSGISLISKADIRYEGKLYSVDPDACTIALSNVKSYGTEDRNASFSVPAQPQIYEYILFRGTDIKDIRVLSMKSENTYHDPAIVHCKEPTTTVEVTPASLSFNPAPSVPLGIVTTSNQDSSQSIQQSAEQRPASNNRNRLTSESESRSSTPNIPSIQTTTVSTALPDGTFNGSEKQKSKTSSSYTNRDKYYSTINHQQPLFQNNRPRYDNHSSYQQRYPRYRDYNNTHPHQQHRGFHDYRERNNKYMGRPEMRQFSNRPDTRRNNYDDVQQQQQQQQSTGRKPRNTLKFTDEYDFEQANTEFEQMISQLEKTKLNELVNGDGGNSSGKDDSELDGSEGHENSFVVANNEDKEKPVFYDKVKSFFDQISYEAIERSKGARVDWKTERKINSETFGPLALRRNTNFHNRGGGNHSAGYYNNNAYPNRNNMYGNGYRHNYNYYNNNNSYNNNFMKYNREQNYQRKPYLINNTPRTTTYDSGKENRTRSRSST